MFMIVFSFYKWFAAMEQKRFSGMHYNSQIAVLGVTCFAKLSTFSCRSNDKNCMDKNFRYQKQKNVYYGLLLIALNQYFTVVLFFHWLTLVFCGIFWLM